VSALDEETKETLASVAEKDPVLALAALRETRAFVLCRYLSRGLEKNLSIIYELARWALDEE
jgi:hypothetical protein